MLIVVKVGGSILGEGVSPTILNDIKKVSSEHKMILVHGGGREVTDVAEKLGKEQRFIVSPGGIRSRYTDKETSIIYTMVMAGKINKEIVAALQKMGVNAIGLSGVDGAILKAQRKKRLIVMDEKGRKRLIDGGYTGKIQGVNGDLLKGLVEDGYLPVIAPVALSEEYEFLNVDGDRAAAYVAGGSGADKIVFLTDVEGVMVEDKIVPKFTAVKAKELLPKIGFGMEKKIIAALEALDMSVEEVVIGSGLIPDPITSAIDHTGGTVISRE